MPTRITEEAERQFQALPLTIRSRIANVIERLNGWPHVSGAKPLRNKLAGKFRIRTGDYRVQFYINDSGDPVIEKIGKRDRFYDD